ncbi:hypothetical protein [Sinorhizobium fredii]|uniref:hypothetical protein n=1 Tax=Rhizobium fredii TaxID=380 RepID=UPI001FDA1806|nr:hypothetical protein [Sinorhizobium fredii]
MGALEIRDPCLVVLGLTGEWLVRHRQPFDFRPECFDVLVLSTERATETVDRGKCLAGLFTGLANGFPEASGFRLEAFDSLLRLGRGRSQPVKVGAGRRSLRGVYLEA